VTVRDGSAGQWDFIWGIPKGTPLARSGRIACASRWLRARAAALHAKTEGTRTFSDVSQPGFIIYRSYLQSSFLLGAEAEAESYVNSK
jgi:hypothetical protein